MNRALVAASILAALIAPAVAVADAEDEARARTACAGGRAELRLKAEEEDGTETIEVELRVDARRGARQLRIVVLHERRLLFSGVRSTTREGSYRLRRPVADWPGRETFTARIGTPGGRTCVLEATI
jgi:hypothetical protein